MGCFQSKDFKLKDNPSNFLLPIIAIRNNQGIDLEQSLVFNSEINFQISFADLCQEKQGIIQNDYILFNPPIGVGSFGEVRQALHKSTGLKRAIKIVPKDTCPLKKQKKLIKEIEILKSLDHPNILKVYEFYQDEKNIYIVTELCTGGELFEKIMSNQISEKQIAEIMRQMLSALYYCHEKSIVHRDVKPENILFQNEDGSSLIKIIDFGIAKKLNTFKTFHNKKGTTLYMSPETIKEDYDEKCDVWSCGVLFYLMLAKTYPFNGSTTEEIEKQIMDSCSGLFLSKLRENSMIPEGAINLLKKMLEYDSKKRITIEKAFHNDWIQQYNLIKTIDEKIIQRTLKNLLQIKFERKLQEFIWMFFVNNFSSSMYDNKDIVLHVFQSVDLNGDGILSKEELVLAYRKIFGDLKKSEKYVEKIFKYLDSNKNGSIDFSEFVIGALSQENFLTRKRLKIGFRMFDKDNSGSISLEEFKSVFAIDKIKDDDWKLIIKEADDNGDGEISYSEFENMMKRFLRQ